MSVKRLRLAHNIAVIVKELEIVESNIISANTTPSQYTNNDFIDKLDNLINQRANLIIDLNETLSSYNEYVESLKD